MIYFKIINEQMVFSDCRTIQTDEGVWISNPSAEQIAASGWQVYVPPVIPPKPELDPAYDSIVEAVKKMLEPSCESLTDEEALEVAALFPTWASKIGKEVAAGERLWYNEKLWKALQAHTAMENWTPDTATSLYVEVSIEEFPEWKQPVGSSDAYNKGDKVSHNGKHWVSDVDANVWEPGVYGWSEV